MNRLRFSNKNKKAEHAKRHERKRRIKSKVYWDKSCLHCGLPDKGYNAGALNRFGQPIKNNKSNCLLCGNKLS